MNILYFGDVLGKTGREAVISCLPVLKDQMKADLTVVCAENATHGFGLSARHADDFFEAGADVLTMGNHVWDQREIIPYIDKNHRLIRPANYPPGAPGVGHVVVEAGRGRKVLVLQVMGRLFMDQLDCPFRTADDVLARYPLSGSISAILVDIHAEASSEKMAFGHYCDGRVSAVVGSHSHIPTADAHVMSRGTGYITDAGMCGDYDSVIGMVKEPSIHRFVRKTPADRLSPAQGEATVCGVLIRTDDATGLARSIEPFRTGGILAPTIPAV